MLFTNRLAGILTFVFHPSVLMLQNFSRCDKFSAVLLSRAVSVIRLITVVYA